jgi:branched-chain amino acid aminotransferase
MRTATPGFTVQRVKRSRLPELDFGALGFGTVYSDHMLSVEYADGRWGEPVLLPFGPIPLSPATAALHYGQSVFEGLKAYRAPGGEILLFRPADNAGRFRRSAERMAMPPVPEPLFVDGLRELVRLDAEWVPPAGAGALYIRPLLFATEPSIRVRPAERYRFLCFTFPFGGYFPPAIDALVSTTHARAFPGGTGDVKPAGNYGPGLVVETAARAEGCDTVLWLDARERRYVEECGVMNLFVVLGDVVVTPPLDGTILGGVTRDSVLTLLRDAGHRVEERPLAIDEVVAAHREGRLRECFGTGTAATLAHIRRLRHDGADLVLPPIESRTVGPAVKERLIDLMSGRAPDPYGWLLPLS